MVIFWPVFQKWHLSHLIFFVIVSYILCIMLFFKILALFMCLLHYLLSLDHTRLQEPWDQGCFLQTATSLLRIVPGIQKGLNIWWTEKLISPSLTCQIQFYYSRPSLAHPSLLCFPSLDEPSFIHAFKTGALIVLQTKNIQGQHSSHLSLSNMNCIKILEIVLILTYTKNNLANLDIYY